MTPANTQPARVFRALPPTPGTRGFAQSWWGRAWITALEQSSLDTGRLARGRTYARRSAVGQITAAPGRITAQVRGSQPQPYTSTVHIRTLNDAEWNRLLDAVAAKAGHLAALLDRDMPAELVQDAAEAGVRLLPHPGELTPECTCPDWGDPCKHAAALCYQVSRILDADPFVLLLLRGRDESAIMNELHRRNTARAEPAHVADAADTTADHSRTAGPVRAREAFAATASPAGMPHLPEPVAKPGAPTVLDTLEQPPGDLDSLTLEILGMDAARRAKDLLDHLHPCASPATPLPPLMPELDARRDLIRLLADNGCDPAMIWRIATEHRFKLGDLTLSVEAWRQAGLAGLTVHEETWTPSANERTRLTTAINEAWTDYAPPAIKVNQNWWTFTEYDAQLRYGRDRRWYPYLMGDWGWTPLGKPTQDAAGAMNELFE